MKTAPQSSPLLDLLEAEDLSTVADGVPDALWEKALRGPARDLFSRPGKGLRTRLVEAGWRLGGGVGACPTPVPLLVEILHAGSLVVDDIEDGSTHRRGEPALHHRYGLPRALNLGNWMYFWPQRIVRRLGLPPDVELGLHQRLADTLYLCHLGQGLDLSAHAAEVPREKIAGVVAATTALKTGALTELAVSLGALVALARPARVGQLARFGRDAGIALQMLDDLGNLVGHKEPSKQHEDLRLGRATWPWAWLAELVDDATFERLQRRLRDLDQAPARLTRAVDGLRGAVGAAADPFADELMHLEERYVAAV